jgi:hypothetical protein
VTAGPIVLDRGERRIFVGPVHGIPKTIPATAPHNGFDKFSDLTGFNYNFRSLMGDLNGDGRIDVLTEQKAYLSQVNVQTSFISQSWTYDLEGRDRRRTMITDVDGDGFDDFIWFTGRRKITAANSGWMWPATTGEGLDPLKPGGRPGFLAGAPLAFVRRLQTIMPLNQLFR